MAGQGFEQSQSLQLQQTIAPQMQQSLQVLQSATLELRHLIQQELEVNPALEDETEEISLEETIDNDPEPDDNDFDEEFDALLAMDEDWRDAMRENRQLSPRNTDDDERHQFLMDSLSEPITLQEHLLNQLGLANLSTAERNLAEQVIGNIDDDGFLAVPIEDMCFDLGIPLRDLEIAKATIQSFDPVGVGAENLRECLLIQLERLDKRLSVEHRIVEHHLDDLARNRHPLIARKLGVSPEQVARAAEFISTLDPRPGSRFAESSNVYVTPDVVVERVGDDYEISLTNEHIPRLRISNAYKELMARSSTNNGGREARSYLRDKIRNGKFLIRSIHQRQQTIENIAHQILKRQREFFDRGPSHLKPMNMAQIADAVEVHETTVSRAVSGKYIATPHGVFEMKYFFTSGYHTDQGEEVSNTSVKKALAELVANEDPAKPFSDSRIVKELDEKGIHIARRTVAKYRDELNILPSHLRKRHA
jgi:RNA polymerase sigma-54 factor